MIVIEQAQSHPTVLHLSPWIQSAASIRVCVCVRACMYPCVRPCSLPSGSWQMCRYLWATVRVCGSVSVFVGLWKAPSMLCSVRPLCSRSEEAVWWWRILGRSSQQPSNNTVPHEGGKRAQPRGTQRMKAEWVKGWRGGGGGGRDRKQQRGKRGRQGPMWGFTGRKSWIEWMCKRKSKERSTGSQDWGDICQQCV